jgi:hypothetical protein
MSDNYLSYIHVVFESRLSDCFGEEISELLSGRKIPRHLAKSITAKGDLCELAHHEFRCGYKRLDISTRNGYLHKIVDAILKRSGIESLRFLTWDIYTHQYDVDGEPGTYFTVLNPYYDELLSSINKMHQWCLENSEYLVNNLDRYGYAPEDVAKLLDLAFASLQPNEDCWEDGDNLHFMFCVLKTIEDLLRYAKFMNNYMLPHYEKCWMIYEFHSYPGIVDPPKLVSNILEP